MDKKAFSLIEVIAAMGILIIGMVGLSSLLFQNLKVQRVNANNLVASMLAQEGLELVRNRRDNNWLGGLAWNSGYAIANATTTFAINFTGATSTAGGIASSSARLFFDNTTGYYTSSSSGNAITPFRRLITVGDYPISSSTVVKSLVRWRDGVKVYDYIAETVLYDWR